MHRIFFCGGQKGAPRNVESIKYDVKMTPRMSRNTCRMSRGQKGQKNIIYFILFQNHEVIRASRKYPIKEIGGMIEKPPPKIIILGTMRGTPKKKTKIKHRKGVK
jgi:hypothetical protein